ncbi:hypothetical protein H2248_005428 [Termitomyces sp. 'cryptogamus']|nr:hypothetical protein H2248_005428 [Termitomyces sp. 'cryptogamus']
MIVQRTGLMRSHDVLRQTVKREDTSGDKFGNDDSQKPCTLYKSAQAPCSASSKTRHSEGTVLIPSDCTCNHVFFNLWSACLGTEGTLSEYEEWAQTCRNHSLEVLEEYPSRWASRVTIPSWAAIVITNNPALNASTAVLVARASETSGLVPIVAPIAGVLGLVTLGIGLAYLYWYKKGNEESFGTFLRRHICLRKAHEIRRKIRDRDFEIDQSEGTNNFVMIRAEDDYISGHTRGPSGDSMKFEQPEYHFPFRNVWRNSQIIQQVRRIPDMVPHLWGDGAVYIRPSQPGHRFRVDPSGNSSEGSNSSVMHSLPSTVEGAIPETIYEDDEDTEGHHYDNEEESLITHPERLDNEVFLISNGRPDFTISDHSSNSHQFRIVPPTPSTESFRSDGPISQVTLPHLSQRPIDIPPAPRLPAPVPPGTSPRRPSPLHVQHGPVRNQSPHHQADFNPFRTKPVPQLPQPVQPGSTSQPVSGLSSKPLHIETGQPPPQAPDANVPPIPNIPPHSGTPSQPSQHQPLASKAVPDQQIPGPQSPPAPRRPSNSNIHQPHRRPMGARRPSSPHVPHRPSLDEELGKFGPTIPSGDSMNLMSPRPPTRPLTPPSPRSPPPRPVHGRTTSSESVGMVPGDNRSRSARRPSSPHVTHRPSLDEELDKFMPFISTTGDFMIPTSPTRLPPRSLTPPSPHPYQLSFSGEGVFAPVSPPPHPTHGRTASPESMAIPLPGPMHGWTASSESVVMTPGGHRPIDARRPSSPHVRHWPSLDEEFGKFGPTIPSGESMILTSPTRPPRPLTPLSPHAHQLSLPGEDMSLAPVLHPPRPTRGRTASSENVVMAPADNRFLYPGPVRAVGVNLPLGATESLESLHSRPLPMERTHH